LRGSVADLYIRSECHLDGMPALSPHRETMEEGEF
jgi:hypothetical protein